MNWKLHHLHYMNHLKRQENSPAVCHTSNGTEEYAKANGEQAHQHQQHHSLTIGFVKEFNFDHGNGCDTLKPYVNSDRWTNAKDIETEGTTTRAWSFFPTTQRS